MKPKKDKGYCYYCDDYVEYDILEEVEMCCPKDQYMYVSLLKPICLKCGRDVVVPSIETENKIRLSDEHRKQNGLLTSSEIKSIRKKRNLSQAELARLIGAGEKTITRYELGTIQDKVFDTLLRMLDDDAAYEALIKLSKKI